ncbi:methylamine dehydrogenase light chain [Gluconacetobacter diazotrophicus PA1 5]|uniref:Methylamine dehydrogenase (amicyanin) n=1 Tax=Gluconacetobacter diazotrophicus (strain ATCC 49037 / DSM 5601 / CCUG 37298 / CIP 103539 / LMG 7603 / PAl5) TaxID=272568 RepID=A9HIC0_GLUDA|nr:methylamine dehydrogenase (amicyanin) small subunit [Gluconacetobacter diazotrophicus]ACI49838.1 methylamine dehydrogenase light chain [Gluconacetobacter diazotrophicus PA1 5]TWB10313.1 methylamine dehydrogenase light chain [Gluconacetobacter diazotrophicus]CAP55750.1 putative methylamine dehydrogenase light chain precursor [Gluconacetobacter diazotrophicus PA1 5]
MTRVTETRNDMERNGFDRLTERLARYLAGRSSRRGALARLGGWAASVPLFPLLPVWRGDARAADAPAAPSAAPSPFAAKAQAKDDTKCDYWRYCAIDGNLCTTCGGGVHSCPPGTHPSPTSWIGTCFNPQDRRSYLIAYRDCCGQDACNEQNCLGTDGDLPTYRPQANNDIIWCFGTGSLLYNCSTAAIVGTAE